ncbi:hypothetical protein C3942_15460, partial [Solimonas fluminis]
MRKGLPQRLQGIVGFFFLALLAFGGLAYAPSAEATCSAPTFVPLPANPTKFRVYAQCDNQADALAGCVAFFNGIGQQNPNCRKLSNSEYAYYEAGWYSDLNTNIESYLLTYQYCPSATTANWRYEQDKLIVYRTASITSATCPAPPPDLTVAQNSSGCEAPKPAGWVSEQQANPVNCTNGLKDQQETDYRSADFSFSRSYFGKPAGWDDLPDLAWRASRPTLSISHVLSYQVAVFSYGQMRRVFIRSLGGTTWQRNRYDDGALLHVSGLPVYKLPSGVQFEFDAQSRLSARVEADGRRTTIAYSSGNAYGGTTETHTTANGRSYTADFDIANQLRRFTDAAGQHTDYAWDAQGRLVSTTYPDDTPADSTDDPVRQYLYEDPVLPNALTGIVDENGDRYATYAYDGQGRAVLSEHAGGARRHTFEYLSGNTTRVRQYQDATRYTESLVTYVTPSNKRRQISSVAYSACPDCSLTNNTESYGYDSNGWPASRIDRRGVLTEYVYNNSIGRETSRIEAKGSAQERSITTNWNASWTLPSSIVEPGKTRSYSYNSKGQTTSASVNTSDGNRTTNYTWTGVNLTYVNGPRTDVGDISSFAYDGQNNLSQVTNALGQVTQITDHDAH